MMDNRERKCLEARRTKCEMIVRGKKKIEKKRKNEAAINALMRT